MLNRTCLTMGAVAFIACGFANRNEAKADWQYTKWGMTPAEVKEASKGQAIENKDPNISTSSLNTKLVSNYVEDATKLTFQVIFKFNDRDKIQEVELKLNSGGCAALESVVSKFYGPSQSYSSSVPRWWDRENKNIISIFNISGTCCSIHYEAMRDPNRPGGL